MSDMSGAIKVIEEITVRRVKKETPEETEKSSWFRQNQNRVRSPNPKSRLQKRQRKKPGVMLKNKQPKNLQHNRLQPPLPLQHQLVD